MASNSNAAASSATSSAAAARRRKILERGADRLALITGQARTLPSESDYNSNAAVSSQPLNSNQEQAPGLSVKIAASPNNGVDGGFSSILPDGEAAGGSGNLVEPPLYVRDTTSETSRASTLDKASDEQSSLASSMNQKSNTSPSGVVPNLESRACSRRFVTLGQVSSAITASERWRLICSIAVALLVVLSSSGFPLLGSNVMKSIISVRPLYLLLLTNITLVLARILVSSRRGFERTVRGENNIPSTNHDWVEQASKALEVGLVVQKAMDAMLMDCSVYALIVISGFSFAK